MNFFFKKGIRTQCNLLTNLSGSSWTDHLIPNKTEITKVQMMVSEQTGCLLGFRFFTKNHEPILTCGRMIDDPNCESSPGYLIKEFNLEENQRIVGFKSYSGGGKIVLHYDL